MNLPIGGVLKSITFSGTTLFESLLQMSELGCVLQQKWHSVEVADVAGCIKEPLHCGRDVVVCQRVLHSETLAHL